MQAIICCCPGLPTGRAHAPVGHADGGEPRPDDRVHRRCLSGESRPWWLGLGGGPEAATAQGPTAWTTNQRMEIRAALDAVTSIEGPMVVVSDSTYVVNCFRDRWWEGWLARGWLNTAKKPVANRDLWEPLIQAYRSDPGRIKFRWVKGHGSDAMNDLVDRLAVAAAGSQSGREGTGSTGGPRPRRFRRRRRGKRRRPAASNGGDGGSDTDCSRPAVRSGGAGGCACGRYGWAMGLRQVGRPVWGLAPASRPAANQGRQRAQGGSDPRVPDGHKVVVTGLKPPDLGGYDDNAIAARVRAKLAEILAAKRRSTPT